MKAVILAGGLGTRLSEETAVRPKPMVEIGGKPILWHIMKIYSTYGINDFIICCGYKGHVIKEYFGNYFIYNSNVTFSLADNTMTLHDNRSEPWKVTLVDTGEKTMTGGRLKRVADYLEGEQAFCFTYGDGLSNVNISDLIRFHFDHGNLATLTAVKPPGRYGSLKFIDHDIVASFHEKPDGDGSWINGGFFVLSPEVLNLIDNDSTVFEVEPLANLAEARTLKAFYHEGFWQPMDTLRENLLLNQLWETGDAPWKIW